MKRHFVTFYSPGTFVGEQSTKEIESWDPEKAREMMADIEARYGATPYGFRFTTRKRGMRQLDSEVVETSGMYYVDCKVQTLEDVQADGAHVLADNMRINHWDRVVTTTKGWAWSQPLQEGDVVL